jgi:hypothetical protein
MEPEATFREVVLQGLATILVNRLSTHAVEDKCIVDDLLLSTQLSGAKDNRTSCFEKKGQQLHTSQLYKISTRSGVESGLFRFVWHSHAPPRAKFFGWLLLQERIQNPVQNEPLDQAHCR